MERSPLERFALRLQGIDRTDELDAAAAEVLSAFESDGVPCLLLKGVVLARELYPPEQKRGYSDVDVLVKPDHVADAQRVLIELRYTNTTAARGVTDIGGALHADTWVRRNQRIGPLMLDLHTRLPGVKASPEAAWEALSSRQAAIEVGGRLAPVLSRDALALHLAIHAAQHGLDDARPQADLSYAFGRWPRTVWDAAAALARELDAVDAFAAGLRLVPAGAQLAEELQLPPTPGLEWDLHNRASRPRGTFHLRALMDAGDLRERWLVLRRALWPPREWVVWEDPRTGDSPRRMAWARVKHLARTPIWAARAALYRVNEARSARGR